MSEETENTENTELTEIETRAQAMGWRPKDQLEDDKEFVDAKEFIARKPLFDKIHAQSDRIKDIEATLRDTSGHILKVQEIAYKRALSDLKKERQAAINDADIEKIHDIDSELNQLEESRPVQTAPAEYVAWEKENPWFKADEELFTFACASYDAQIKRTPNTSIDKVLEMVTKTTKRAFPERFETEKKLAHEVEGGTRPTNQSKQPAFNSLNDNQKRVCNNFVKMGIMTKDAYIKSLQDIGEI